MPVCEYCGNHYPKGGAHVTHVRYCDERPVPDEIEKELGQILGDPLLDQGVGDLVTGEGFVEVVNGTDGAVGLGSADQKHPEGRSGVHVTVPFDEVGGATVVAHRSGRG